MSRRSARTARRHARLPSIAGALGLVATVGLGGCAVAGPDASDASITPSPLPTDGLELAVELHQARAEIVDRVLRVWVDNAGPTDVTVTSARLTSAWLDGTSRSAEPKLVPAGTVRQVPVALTDTLCGPADAADPVVELDLADDAGRTATVRLVPTDPRGALTAVHDENCAAAAFATGARIVVDGDLVLTPDPGGATATLALHLERVPGGPVVTLDEIERTTLLDTAEGDSWPVALSTAPGGTTSTVIVAEPARCDAHAVAEDKRGTFLPVRTTVDGVPQALFYVDLGADLRGQVHRFVGEACGW